MENYAHLQVDDGTEMEVYISIPADAVGRTSPGLIVIQEAYGVNHHIRDVADRFAAQGFVVIAPEIFHRTAPPYFEGPYGDFAQVMPHYNAMTVEGMEADLKASYHWLRQHDLVIPENIFSVGY